MSFFCPHQDAAMESCQRLGGLKCRPGMAGCAMFGKVQRLEDDPPKRRTGRRPRPASAGNDGDKK